MNISKYFYTGLFSLACLGSLAAQQANPAPTPSGADPAMMVTIGDPNNSADELGHGSVATIYQVGRYDWTVQDWKNMLDDVASLPDPVSKVVDAHGLWNQEMSPWITRSQNADGSYTYTVVVGQGKKPITHVSYHDICRACNYTQNKGSLPLGDGVSFDSITEHGAYKITVSPDGTQHEFKTKTAEYYVFTQDEYIKAAFYDASNQKDYGWWMYATRNDTNPYDAYYANDSDNAANYDLHSWSPYWITRAPLLALTDVDFFGRLDASGNPIGTYSSYGCFDMNGNVNAWTSTQDQNGNYIVRGGSYESTYGYYENNDLMRTCTPASFSPDTQSDTIGFRMAAVVDPASSSTASNDYGASASASYSGYNPVKQFDKLTTSEAIGVGVLGAVGLAVGADYALGWGLGEAVLGGATRLGSSAVSSCFNAASDSADLGSAASESTASESTVATYPNNASSSDEITSTRTWTQYLRSCWPW